MTVNRHVMPVNDLREHVSRPDCWCKPKQRAEYPGVWIHNSMDRREEYEHDRRGGQVRKPS